MSVLPPVPPLNELEATDQYLVGYGKSGALGVFMAGSPLTLRRGMSVIVRTPRGVELGHVRGPATLRQARVLGAVASGELLRCATAADEDQRACLAQRAEQLFASSRQLARQQFLTIEVLDVELLFDGQRAILQYVGDDVRLEAYAQELTRCAGVEVQLENLAAPQEEHDAGCGKPDCGRGGGGCTSCGSDGGCASCGSHKVDLRDYFAHLRTQMESRRMPLL
jgi:cell fate regulator YaaT (PSP1 superfamily)